MLVSLFDRSKGEFTSPMLVVSEDEAKRNLILAFMSGQDSLLSRFPSQFELYEVGDFRTNDGVLVPMNPRFIMNGLTAKEEAIKSIELSQIPSPHHASTTITPSLSGDEDKESEVCVCQ